MGDIVFIFCGIDVWYVHIWLCSWRPIEDAQPVRRKIELLRPR